MAATVYKSYIHTATCMQELSVQTNGFAVCHDQILLFTVKYPVKLFILEQSSVVHKRDLVYYWERKENNEEKTKF